MTAAAVCLVSGDLLGVNGQALAGLAVRVRVAGQAPVFTVDSRLVANDAAETVTDELGHFELNVLQGLEVVITVDAIGYARHVTIPATSSVNISEL